AAKLEVKQAERGLKTVEDALAAIIADVKKLADELHAPAADAPELDPLEVALKKVVAEYDALALRLAKTQVGRLLATIPADGNYTDDTIQSTVGTDEKKIDQGRRLLKLRYEITTQARMANASLSERDHRRLVKQANRKDDQGRDFEEEIRKNEQDV